MEYQVNNSCFKWHMKHFKQAVRYIISDLEELPQIAEAFGYKMTATEKADLKTIILRAKQYCIGLYEDYSSGRKDITCYVNELRSHFSAYFCTELLFVGDFYGEPVMDPGEPEFSYNSLHVNHEELHFALMEERHDEYMCEMAETHGMGYEK